MHRKYYILILKIFIIGSTAVLTTAYGQYVPDESGSYCDSPANYYNQYCNNNNYSNYNQYTPPQPSNYPYNYYPYYFPGNIIIQNGNAFEHQNFHDEEHGMEGHEGHR